MGHELWVGWFAFEKLLSLWERQSIRVGQQGPNMPKHQKYRK